MANNIKIEQMDMGTLSLVATLKSGRRMRYLVACAPRTIDRQNEIMKDFQDAATLKIAAEKYDAIVEIV